MTEPTEWRVEQFVRAVDGDTVRLQRSAVEHIGDKNFRVYDEDDDGVSVRLVWVDTPERGEVGYRQAREDVLEWAAERQGRLRVFIYPASAGWDRLLGDVVDDTGASLSQWLMVEKGWKPYVEGE